MSGSEASAMPVIALDDEEAVEMDPLEPDLDEDDEFGDDLLPGEADDALDEDDLDLDDDLIDLDDEYDDTDDDDRHPSGHGFVE
jgi:ribonuclease E